MRFLIIVIISIVLFACTQTRVTEEKVDFCASIHRNDSVKLKDILHPVAQKMKNSTGVYVLEDGGGAMMTRAWFSEYAEKTIDIQYFIFSTDNVGLIACDYLVRAADRGVKVRILIDDIMVDATPDEILALDSHHNISIKIYNPGINLGKTFVAKLHKFATDFRDANQRMHNKTFIVDNKVVITGGRNIADEYFDYDHEYNFRDRDVLLLGKETSDVQQSFNSFWESSLSVPVTRLVESDQLNNDPNKYEKLHQYACNPENFWPQVRFKIGDMHRSFTKILTSEKLYWLDSVKFVSDIPGKNDGTNGLRGGGICTDSLVSLIKNAKYSIDIQSPYLITTDAVRALFRSAVERGVKIRILTNSLASTDNLEAFSGYQRDRTKLLETGVEVYEFKPNAANRFKIMTGELQAKLKFTPIFGLHAKTMVIDKHITVIGTYNLDPRSANLNTECVTIIQSNHLAKEVLIGIDDDFKPENAWHTTLRFNPDHTTSKKKRISTWTRKAIPKSIL